MKFVNSKWMLSLGVCSLVVAAVGCSSKFSESSANSVTIKGLSLPERLQQKEKIDGRIDEIQRGVDKAKKIIDLLKQVQNPNETANVYTPIDFLLDLNNELKSKMPENSNNKLMRYGKIRVPLKNLSEECQIIETALESSTLYDTNTKDPQAIGERLTYSLKTCQKDSKLTPAITADWIGSEMQLKLDNAALETVFRDMLKSVAETSTDCKFKMGEKDILEELQCHNMEVKLSASETAQVLQLDFNNNSEVRFESRAEIYENANLKAHFYLKILENGQKDLQIKKIGEK